MDRSDVRELRRGAAPRRLLRAATAALLGATLAAGCAGVFSRHHHFDREGPLSASTGTGGNMLVPVKGAGYRSFGANMLCAHDEGTEIELERVTHHALVKPLKIELWLRRVNYDDIGKKGYVPGSFMPFYSTGGRPPYYKGDDPYAGIYTRHIAGRKITLSCERMRKAWTGLGYTDLIVVMKVDKRGGLITGLTIEYRVGGREYALDTRWKMGVCGTAVTSKTRRNCEDI